MAALRCRCGFDSGVEAAPGGYNVAQEMKRTGMFFVFLADGHSTFICGGCWRKVCGCVRTVNGLLGSDQWNPYSISCRLEEPVDGTEDRMTGAVEKMASDRGRVDRLTKVVSALVGYFDEGWDQPHCWELRAAAGFSEREHKNGAMVVTADLRALLALLDQVRSGTPRKA